MGSVATSEFAAAASNAGALGGIGTLNRPTADVRRDLEVIRNLTDRPFAVNHAPPCLDETAFAETLRLQPAVISFALGDPGELVDMAKAAGAKTMLQATTVAQAVAGAERGIDVIIAQGAEAGGYGGSIGTMPLVPQVVDAVAPVPVVAAGGIFDGRGLAAALMLGAVGVNMGTRFLASTEAPIDEPWRQMILDASSEDTVKAEIWNALYPITGEGNFGTVLRSLRTPFIDQWNARLDEAGTRRDELAAEVDSAHATGRERDVLATAGQGAGAITVVLPMAEIVRRLMAEAEMTFQSASAFGRSQVSG
jgi:nitronate monooxygenase/enoyl-[acyl-carrier protein] reductase II